MSRPMDRNSVWAIGIAVFWGTTLSLSDQHAVAEAPSPIAEHTVGSHSVTLRVERDSIGIVDPFVVEIVVAKKEDENITDEAPSISRWRVELPSNEFESLGQTSQLVGGGTSRIRLTLQSLATGQLSLGPLRLVDPSTGESLEIPATSITISSSLPEDHQPQDFRDIKPAILQDRKPPSSTPWVYAGALTAALILVAVVLRRRAIGKRHVNDSDRFKKQLDEIRTQFEMQQLTSREAAGQTMHCVTEWLATHIGDQVFSQSSEQLIESIRVDAEQSEMKWKPDRIDELDRLVRRGDELRYSERISRDRQRVIDFVDDAKKLIDAMDHQPDIVGPAETRR